MELLSLRSAVFGAALIKKRRYWLVNIKGGVIDVYFSLKEVFNVDSVKQVEDWVAYGVFFMKDSYYVIKLMNTYVMLEPTDKRTQRKFKHGGNMETKDFMYMEVVTKLFVSKSSLLQQQQDACTHLH